MRTSEPAFASFLAYGFRACGWILRKRSAHPRRPKPPNLTFNILSSEIRRRGGQGMQMTAARDCGKRLTNESTPRR